MYTKFKLYVSVLMVNLMNQWISVKERLPEESDSKEYTARTLAGINAVKVVLWMSTTHEPHAAHWKSGRMGKTHWMSLPDPPNFNVALAKRTAQGVYYP